ncbi:hypothetical protein [Streptomyces noursei]|uniref:hypothetical protein n=1 Tax=Streptomyces noursei TaxID=1971 RepID=UPI0021556B29|nr:hypothetical protein [Streptomyces noursei]
MDLEEQAHGEPAGEATAGEVERGPDQGMAAWVTIGAASAPPLPLKAGGEGEVGGDTFGAGGAGGLGQARVRAVVEAKPFPLCRTPLARQLDGLREIEDPAAVVAAARVVGVLTHGGEHDDPQGSQLGQHARFQSTVGVTEMPIEVVEPEGVPFRATVQQRGQPAEVRATGGGVHPEVGEFLGHPLQRRPRLAGERLAEHQDQPST